MLRQQLEDARSGQVLEQKKKELLRENNALRKAFDDFKGFEEEEKQLRMAAMTTSSVSNERADSASL